MKDIISTPKPGRTLLATVKYWGEPWLRAQKTLIRSLKESVGFETCKNTYNKNYSFLNYNNSYQLKEDILYSLCSASLILNWIIGRSTKSLLPKASLIDAETWALGANSNSNLLSKELTPIQHVEILSPLNEVSYDKRIFDILPYASEVFETSEEILLAYGSSRKSKRAAGIFYTPSDVTNYIISTVFQLREKIKKPDGTEKWIDPACGTGCFLKSILSYVQEKNQIKYGSEILDYFQKYIFGIDLSPIALQSGAYMITGFCLNNHCEEGHLVKGLKKIGKNLTVCNTALISGYGDLIQINKSLETGADFVVSNPPYIKNLKLSFSDQFQLFSIPKSFSSQYIYLDFLKRIYTLSNENNGVGGMVVPLSVTYNNNKEFVEFRKFTEKSRCLWKFANFDRTPDSLFGDDVKTRNTIVLFSRERSNSFYTTELRRWNSRNRSNLFQTIKYNTIQWNKIDGLIPKIGDGFESNLFDKLYKTSKKPMGLFLRKTTKNNSSPKTILKSSNTAYNWLSFEVVYDWSEKHHLIDSKASKCWNGPTDEFTIVAFSMLQSRLTYWLWRVWGDGFHLTDQFLQTLPYCPSALSEIGFKKLQGLGINLWEDISENKITSCNKGKASYSFSPHKSGNLINQIDVVLTKELKLPEATPTFLAEFLKKTIIAGRENESFMNSFSQSMKTEEKICGKN